MILFIVFFLSFIQKKYFSGASEVPKGNGVQFRLNEFNKDQEEEEEEKTAWNVNLVGVKQISAGERR